ncbi:MAG: transglutaminase domain-containing protein [Planctomycetota bacterium]|jgi:transglutaminase-like putative cysteine protease
MRSSPVRFGSVHLLLAVSLCLLAVAPLEASGGSARVLEDNWYGLYMQGQKAGHHHEKVVELETPEGLIFESTLRQEFAFTRAGMEMRFVTETVIREDTDGHLLAFTQKVAGPMTLAVEGRVEGEELVIESRGPRGVQTTRVPAHDGLCPWALDRLRREKGHEPGTTYSARAFLAEAPSEPVEVSASVVGREEVQIYEVKKRLHRTDIKISALPGVTSAEWSDEAGTVWLVRMSLAGGFTLESRKAPRDLATAPDDPAELLAASYVAVDRPIPYPRRLEFLRILLEPLREGLDLSLPSGPYQQVDEGAEGGVEVILRRAHPAPESSYALPYAGPEHAGMMGANVWMETEDELVRQLSREAVGEESDAVRAARRIESFVDESITEKNLSLGMATAAEAAAQKAGDCTEHAVLAAALARVAGMPSRVVGGLVYVERLPGAEHGGFGYHMWAEVYVGQWLPVDAALGGHDATHLTLVRSDLNGPDDLFKVSSAISRFFGAVRVRVLEFRGGPEKAEAAGRDAAGLDVVPAGA